MKSTDCLNSDIEWSPEYLNSIRNAFSSETDADGISFAFDHPQSYVKNQFEGGFGTMPSGSLGDMVSSSYDGGLNELNHLLNDEGEEANGVMGHTGGEAACFEIFYKQTKGKTKVRIFSVARKCFKLQMTRNTSEVFALKMQ